MLLLTFEIWELWELRTGKDNEIDIDVISTEEGSEEDFFTQV